MSPQNSSSGGTACTGCQGNGLVQNANGVVQPCPLCGGSGDQEMLGEFYTYSATATLAALASTQLLIYIQNTPFKWYFSTSIQTGAFTVQITDSKNSRAFFSVTNNNSTSPGQLHYGLVFGTAANPFPVLNPWTFPQNGGIQINLTDISDASNTIWIGFIGVQLVNIPQSASSKTSSAKTGASKSMSGFGRY